MNDSDPQSPEHPSQRPIVRLRPKANARALRHGFPWAFDNEIVTDRRTRALPPGTIARLEDNERDALGSYAINPNSRLFARMLDANPEAAIDADWFAAKLTAALALREQLFDAPYYRLIHAEGDGLPGLVIDRFGDAFVVQPNAAWVDQLLPDLIEALNRVIAPDNIVINASGRSRKAEGLDDVSHVAKGALDGPLHVPMNGATYLADLEGGQKTGLYFDQRENHAFAARLVTPDTKVLDVFSHVGGFALAALAAGAKSAQAVDASQAALDLAQAGADAMGHGAQFSTHKGDAFDVMAELAADEQRFDLVICDPPAFAPSKNALTKGLRAYERVARMAASLVAPGGYLVLCSCSHAADVGRFGNASMRGIGRAGRAGQLIRTGFAGPDHPMLPQLAENGYLKALFYRLD